MDDTSIKRKMPADFEAERGLVGALIFNKEKIIPVAAIVSPDDFYYTQFKYVYQAILELDEEHMSFDDPIVLIEKLKSLGVPEQNANPEFVREIMEATIYSSEAEDYARIIKKKAILRSTITLVQNVENSCYEPDADAQMILGDAERSIFSLYNNTTTKTQATIKDIVIDVVRDINESSKKKGNVTGVPSGFRDLDFRTSGFQNSDLVLIAARPSMGKTAFALNIARHVGIVEDQYVAIFSLEMSKEQLCKRFLSMESGVDAQKLTQGNLIEAEWERLIDGAGIVAGSKLVIDDTAGMTLPEFRSKCRRFKIDYDIKMVIIDYLQLMSAGGRVESRQNEVAEISRALKALARELNVPILALSQLSRQVEQRQDKRPMLSDLRESGAIEQDADVVMFIYRDDYYNKDTDQKGVSEIIVAKQRNGPVGTTKLAWLSEFTMFKNLEYSETSSY